MSRPARNDLTQEELRAMLSYDPETGVFVWVNCASDKMKTNALAGYLDRRGYRFIRVKTKPYLAHRLAWLYHYGKWPTDILDHKNMDRSDNRISNLREASTSQNQMNVVARRNNQYPKGVRLQFGKFQANITKHGQRYYLGSFETEQEAKAAYSAASIVLFGEFRRVA